MLGPFLETLLGGLLTGVLYSLVALGFVLIFKASGVFNFAQGAMVLTAALALVRALDLLQQQWHWPFGLSLAAAFLFAGLIMAIVAWAAERLVLRKLVNQERGVTVVLIEHDMGVVMDISDHVVVLDRGRRIAAGTPEEVQRDPAVIQAYLGTSRSERA